MGVVPSLITMAQEGAHPINVTLIALWIIVFTSTIFKQNDLIEEQNEGFKKLNHLIENQHMAILNIRELLEQSSDIHAKVRELDPELEKRVADLMQSVVNKEKDENPKH